MRLRGLGQPQPSIPWKCFCLSCSRSHLWCGPTTHFFPDWQPLLLSATMSSLLEGYPFCHTTCLMSPIYRRPSTHNMWEGSSNIVSGSVSFTLFVCHKLTLFIGLLSPLSSSPSWLPLIAMILSYLPFMVLTSSSLYPRGSFKGRCTYIQ